MNRKTFITSLVRYGLLTALLAVSGFLLKKSHNNPENCVENPFCKSCGEWDHCTLPQASKLKAYGKE